MTPKPSGILKKRKQVANEGKTIGSGLVNKEGKNLTIASKGIRASNKQDKNGPVAKQDESPAHNPLPKETQNSHQIRPITSPMQVKKYEKLGTYTLYV